MRLSRYPTVRELICGVEPLHDFWKYLPKIFFTGARIPFRLIFCPKAALLAESSKLASFPSVFQAANDIATYGHVPSKPNKRSVVGALGTSYKFVMIF